MPKPLSERVIIITPEEKRRAIAKMIGQLARYQPQVAYGILLKDPRWQKRRLEIMQRDGWKCAACDSDTRTLHVHHRRYNSGAMPWEYGDDDLVTLCDGCHKAEHS